MFLQSKTLKLEIAKLRRRLLIQEDMIKQACERLEVGGLVCFQRILRHVEISKPP